MEVFCGRVFFTFSLHWLIIGKIRCRKRYKIDVL